VRPPKPLQDGQSRWRKNSSQADSAGSIPVTRSTAMFDLIGIRVTFFGGSGRARFEHPMSQR